MDMMAVPLDAMNCGNVRLFMQLMKVINEYVDQEVAEVLRNKRVRRVGKTRRIKNRKRPIGERYVTLVY